MIGWTDDHLLRRMRKGWRGGLIDGTPCGNGSTLNATQSIRQGLPKRVERYGIRSVCDAGAGDLHWVHLVEWQVNYQGFDLVPRVPGVTEIDITREVLPKCDAILCRHVLIHLDPARIEIAISNFRKASTYLFASQYDDAPAFDASKQFNPTDLRGLLGDPIDRIPDAGSDLALWRLSS